MRIWTLGLALGLASAGAAQLPIATGVTIWLLVIGALLLAGIATSRRTKTARCLRLASGALAGYAWSMLSIASALDARLPDCIRDGQHRLLVQVLEDPSVLTGRVEDGVRLHVRVQAQDGRMQDPRKPGCADLRGRHLRLAWYRTVGRAGVGAGGVAGVRAGVVAGVEGADGERGVGGIAKGDQWWITARLKAPWGHRNPGGFDYTRWMLGRGLQGSGYIVEGQLFEAGRLDAGARLRGALRGAFIHADLANGGVIYALTTGDGSFVGAGTWSALRDSGTVHLMVVSGLHVGLVAGIGYGLGSLLPRMLPVVLLWFPSNLAGTLVALAGSAAYVGLTGGGVPGRRAWLMAAAFMLLRLGGRRVAPGSVLLLVFIAVLLADPAAVHQQGLWLSFAAVTTLVGYFHGRLHKNAGWRATFRAQLQAQLALAIGLSPWLAALTGEVPLLGPLANFFVVPILSLAILPGSLLCAGVHAVAPEIAWWGIVGLDKLIGFTLASLGALSGAATLLVKPDVWLAGGAVFAAVCALNGLALRPLTAVMMLWLGWTLSQRVHVADGEFRVLALDVGQGSAIVVDTARHRLLFDTGPGFPSGYNLGSTVIVPSIVATGPARLDAVVLSHADLDHTGGASTIAGRMSVSRTFGSLGVADVEPCNAGTVWTWDGVRFEFLNAHSWDRAYSDNDRSCVLHVASATRRALLAGDISTKIEAELGRELGRVDLMFAPHHGSRSSSSKAFVRLSSASIIFVSAGHANRFGHPHSEVVRRYQENGAQVYVTGMSGALTWLSQRSADVQAHRTNQSVPYWTLRAPDPELTDPANPGRRMPIGVGDPSRT